MFTIERLSTNEIAIVKLCLQHNRFQPHLPLLSYVWTLCCPVYDHDCSNNAADNQSKVVVKREAVVAVDDGWNDFVREEKLTGILTNVESEALGKVAELKYVCGACICITHI